MDKVPSPQDYEFWRQVELKAKELNTDGCTGVRDYRVECCWRHDIAYSTGLDVDGTPVTKAEADRNFRLCIQSRSFFGVCSPMSWIRWLGVRWFGKGIWHKEKRKVQ